MSNLTQLLERYRDDPRVARLAQLLDGAGDPARVQLAGLSGSLDCFLIAGLYQRRGGHHLVIAEDKEEAAYLQNTIANLLKPKPVRFFPDSFKRPLYFEVLEPNNVLQRTETINYLTHSRAKGEIVVTYPEALFEQVVAPEVLNKTRIEIRKDETLDLDTIIEVMAEYGFKREDFVYEPGQFSIRGGIVDIYSYGNE